VAAELAVHPDRSDRLRPGESQVSEAMLVALETDLGEHEHRIVLPREFVVPGETRISAALEVARTVLRRAERRTVTLQAAGGLAGGAALAYLNRTADLLWVLAREAEAAEARAATPSRPARRRGSPAPLDRAP
jgi:cob(I)alamin adenosyltransferase